jgi:hypothetical protein
VIFTVKEVENIKIIVKTPFKGLVDVTISRLRPMK